MATPPISSLVECFENAKAFAIQQRRLAEEPGFVEKIREFCPQIIFASALSTGITALITGIAAYRGRINWLRWLPLPPITIGLAAWALKKFVSLAPEFNS